MTRYFSYIFLMLTVFSCATKTAINTDTMIAETEKKVAEIDSNNQLKETLTEGALTDKKGFKDVGTFKYTVLFDEASNALFRIKNVEITDKTITETYYFSHNELIFIHSETSGVPDKKIVVQNKKVISRQHVTPEEEKLLLAKAHRFQKTFKKAHTFE